MYSCNNPVHEKTALSYKDKLAIKANEFYQQDKFKEAILGYDTLISMDSSKGGYYFKRAYSKSMLLNTNGAIDDYLKSIDRNYSEKEKSLFNLGVLYSLNKKFDSALHCYDECLKLNPENAKARQWRLETLKSQKSK
jgi:tetratricopeptide (TPR) repeat protein